jgi:hypothetical protein
VVIAPVWEARPRHREQLSKRHRDPRGVWLFTITAAMIAGVFVTAWMLTSLGGSVAVTFAAGGVSVVALMVVVTAGLELADGRGRRRLISLLVTIVACVAIMSASWSGALLRLKVVGSEGAWSQAARTACVGNQNSQLNLPGLGRIEQISCDGGQIIFPGPNRAAGLIYSTGSGQPGFPNECVGHISGPWWHYGGNDCSGWPGEMHPVPGV